jgi:hypothetical protein
MSTYTLSQDEILLQTELDAISTYTIDHTETARIRTLAGDSRDAAYSVSFQLSPEQYHAFTSRVSTAHKTPDVYIRDLITA